MNVCVCVCVFWNSTGISVCVRTLPWGHCVRVCVCVRGRVCARLCVYVELYRNKCVCVCVCLWVCGCVGVWACGCVIEQVWMFVSACVCVCACAPFPKFLVVLVLHRLDEFSSVHLLFFQAFYGDLRE
jgi:hypothetical protein